MNGDEVRVLINSKGEFVAKKLIDKLGSENIKIWLRGEKAVGQMNNVCLVEEIDDVSEKMDYVFDLEGERKVWARAARDGARLTLVCVNNGESWKGLKEEIMNSDGNWRLIRAEGVFGQGMTEARVDKGVGFLIRAIELAVENKNLILPAASKQVRLLAEGDLVEAILKATFMSGTEGEGFELWGREISVREIASVLTEEAKMTKFRVLEEEIEVDLAEEEKVVGQWQRLRWEPRGEFKEEIKEVMQYYFSKADEEKRKKKERKVEEPVREKPKLWEVAVEEEEKPKIENEMESSAFAKATADKEELAEEEEILEEEPVVGKQLGEWKIEPLIVKAEEKVSLMEEEQEPVSAGGQIKRFTDQEKKQKKGWWIAGAGLVLIVLLWLPISWVWAGYGIVRDVKKVEKLAGEKKYDEAKETAVRAEEKIRKIDERISDWGVNRWKLVRNGQVVLRVAGEVLSIGGETAELSKQGNIINEAVFGEREIDWKTETEKLRTNLAKMAENLGVLQARLKGDWSWLPARWRGRLQGEERRVEDYRKKIEIAAKVAGVLPEIVGAEGKRKEYLVLLQNENELRPGGGFIGSYAILSFEGGRLSNLDIRDIYEADGQLKGHVEPPEEIKKYLGEAGWYMRDANWQADFVRAAKDIEWFLEKETGRKVDGVVGVNLAVVKAILSVTGEIYVADFKEKINKDNLYEQAEFYAETKFFPGSNQKASFLGGVGRQLFEEIKGLKNEKKLELAAKVAEMLDRNEVQVAFGEKNLGRWAAEMGWDGSIYQGKCAQERCYADYLYLVEANLGVNKANYFIKRNVEQLVEVGTRLMGRVVKINYENTAKSKVWPGGDYKNYLRVYLPEEINLAEVSVMESGRAESKKVYTGEEMKIRVVNGKKEVGLLVEVPIMKKMTVELRYSNEVNLEGKDKFSYLNYIQKQSGFGDTGWVSLVSFPEGWQPVQVQPVASMAGNKILFNLKLEADVRMGVEISK